MNKNTLLLLGGVVVLGVAAYFATRKPSVETPKGIEVAGYAAQDKLDEQASKGIMDARVFIDYPVDEVIYTFKDETVHLVREGTGKESKWLIKSPVDATAVKPNVERMIALFERTVASVHSTPIKAADHVRFDLEPETRVAFTFKSKGAVWNGVDFVVGKVISESSGRNSGQEAAADTWVLRKGDDNTVYRMAGKDLRAPFEVPLSDIRDKKVFKATPTDFVKLELSPPSGPKVVLSGVRTEQPAKPKEPKDGDKGDDAAKPTKPTFKVAWTLTAPAGVRGDKAIEGLARNFANLRTREFVAESDGPKAGDEAGLQAAYTLTGTTHDGKVVAVKLSAVDTDDDKVWAQVVGAKEFLKVDKFAAKNLRKSLADLKDKALFGDAKPESVTMLETSPLVGGPVRVERLEGRWTFAIAKSGQPAAGGAGNWAADPTKALATIVTARATRFATSDELAAANTAVAKPEFGAQLTVKGTTFTLKFGPKIEAEGDTKNQRWAVLSDSATADSPAPPFLIQDFTASRFRTTASDLRRKALFDVENADIKSLNVVWPDGATTVSLSAGADGALVPADMAAGKKPKPGAITTMVATMAKLKAKTFIADKAPASLGLEAKVAYVATATLANGKSLKVTISQKTDGTDPYATVVGGPLNGQVFTLNKFQVDNLQKSPADLVQ